MNALADANSITGKILAIVPRRQNGKDQQHWYTSMLLMETDAGTDARNGIDARTGIDADAGTNFVCVYVLKDAGVEDGAIEVGAWVDCLLDRDDWNRTGTATRHAVGIKKTTERTAMVRETGTASF